MSTAGDDRHIRGDVVVRRLSADDICAARDRSAWHCSMDNMHDVVERWNTATGTNRDVPGESTDQVDGQRSCAPDTSLQAFGSDDGDRLPDDSDNDDNADDDSTSPIDDPDVPMPLATGPAAARWLFPAAAIAAAHHPFGAHILPTMPGPVARPHQPSTVGRDSNVKLAAMENTDVAVAQFAENNILPADLAALNVVLWNLHQQQMFQMHLILQLQQQIIYATASGSHGGVPPIVGLLQGPHIPTSATAVDQPRDVVLPDVLQNNKTDDSSTMSDSVGPGPSFTDPALMSLQVHGDPAATPLEKNSNEMGSSTSTVDGLSGSRPEVRSPMTYVSAPSMSAIPPMLAMMDMSLGRLEPPTKHPKLNGVAPVVSATSSMRMHGGRDDPHYKHRCRYCQKGFTSDSALQIHIRSHTGERPYKCNICGNRFSTKGNLKVHFLCHNEKYPHIRIDQQQQQLQPPPPRHVGVTLQSQPPPLSVFQDVAAGCPVSSQAAQLVAAGDRFFQSRPPLLVPITSGVSGSGGALVKPAPLVSSRPATTCFQSPSSSSLKREFAAAGSTSSHSAICTPPPLTSATQSATDAVDFRRGPDAQLRTPESDEHGHRITPSFAASGIGPTFGSPNNSYESRSSAHSGPTSMLPPPPLSLLSSMSTSLEGFSNPPPFSTSFSSMYRPDIGSSQVLSSPFGPAAVNQPAPPPPPPPPPFGFEPPPMYFGRGATSLRNGKTEVDPLEQFMEIQKSSETTKMEQLVRSIDKKLTDPNQCAVCLRTLSCKSALQMHYRTHTGERPFRCKICGRAFTTKGNLKTHMGVHRAKPPVRTLHACRVCHKQFTNALVLQQHVRAHISSGGNDADHSQLPLVGQHQQLHLHHLQQQQPAPAGGVMMVPSSNAAAAAAAAAMTYMSPFAGYPFFPGAAAAAMAAARYGAPRHPLPHPDLAAMSGARFYGADRCRTASPASDRVVCSSGGGDGGSRRDAASSVGEHEVRAESDDDYRRRDDYDDDDDDDADDNLGDVAAPDRDRDMNIDDVDNSINDEDSYDVDESPQNGSRLAAVCEAAHSGDDEVNGRRNFGAASEPSAGADRIAAENLNSVDDRLDRNRYLSFGDDFAVGSRYSTSLMALEEKVNEINGSRDETGNDAASSSHPLEQMERIIQRTESSAPVSSQCCADGTDQLSSPSSTSASLDCPIRPGTSDQQAMGAHRGLDAINLSPTAFEAATGRPNTTCSVCYKTFACRSALDIHYRSHTKERPFRCPLCPRAFSTKGNMKQHMLTHKPGAAGSLGLGESDAASSVHASDGSCSSSLSCPPDDSCSLKLDDGKLEEAASETSTADAADRDIPPPPALMTTSVTPANVPPELTMSMSNQRLVPDIRTPVPPPTMALPSRAPSPSRRLPNLRHMCHVCQKPFSSASALQIHMRTHTGDKPFRCTVCGKAFTTKGNLKVHMGTHVWNSVPSRRGRRMSVDGLQPPGCHQGADPALMRHHPARSSNMPHPPSDYLAGAVRLPTSGIYPFPFPFGGNGFGPSGTVGMMASKMNEISVIQNRMLGPGGPPGGPPPQSTGAMPDGMPRLPPGLSAIFSPQHAFAAAAAMRLPLPVSFQKLGPADGILGGPVLVHQDRRDIDNNNTPAGEKTGHSGELDLSLKKTHGACPRLSPSLTPGNDSLSTQNSVVNAAVQAAVNSSWSWRPPRALAATPAGSLSPVICSLCSDVCPTSDSLQLHMRTMHRGWAALLQSASGRQDNDAAASAQTSSISAAAAAATTPSPKPPLIAS